MLKLRIYPRGFLGVEGAAQFQSAGSRLSLPPDLEYSQQRAPAAGEMLQNGRPILPNEHVEYLYAAYVKQGVRTNSFEFRKQVLQVAIAAFGVKSFEAWFTSQFQSPAVSDLHARFLDDTLKFVLEGRREMSLENWASLLRIDAVGHKVSGMSEYAKDYFGRLGNREFCGTTSVIQDWCSKPNGIEDLLGTLHILFGSISV